MENVKLQQVYVGFIYQKISESMPLGSGGASVDCSYKFKYGFL